MLTNAPITELLFLKGHKLFKKTNMKNEKKLNFIIFVVKLDTCKIVIYFSCTLLVPINNGI